MKLDNIIKDAVGSDELGLFLIDIEKDIQIDVQIVTLPPNIQKLFEHNKEIKNFNIYTLNNNIQCINEYCFAKFQNNNNYKDGWVYILNNQNQEYLTKVIRNIKYITECWLKDRKEYLTKEYEKYSSKGKDVPMDIQNPYNLISNPTFISETIDQIECTPHSLNISLDSLKSVNSVEKSILLYAASTVLSKKLKTEYQYNKSGILQVETLDFYKVNMMNSDSSVRLMTYMPTWTEDSSGNKCMYTYYLDLYIKSYPNESLPKMVLVPGSTRLRAESLKSDYFKTTSKNIYPFIFLPSEKRLVDEPGCNVFIQGKIINDSNARWDGLFEKSFKKCLIDLPLVKDLYSSPESYLYDEDKTKVYIPHGTHFREATHNVGTGVDVEKRNTLCSSAHKILSESFSNMSNSLTVIPKVGTSKTVCSTRSKDYDNFSLIQGDLFEFDVIYSSDSLKDLMEKIQRYYNSWDFSDLNLLNVQDRTLKSSCYTLRNILENTKKESFSDIKKDTTVEDLLTMDLDPIKEPPKTKIKINLINQVTDLKLNLNLEKATKDTLDVVKKQLLSNKKAFRKNLKTASKSAIIEVPDKKHFKFKGLVDLKKSFKHNLCSLGKVSQVINYKEGMSEKKRYYIIFKCIIELLRQEGYLKTNPGKIMDIYESKFNIEKTGENSLHIGLSYIQSFKSFSYAAIYKGIAYGLKDNAWVPINDSLCFLGSEIWDKESIKSNYDKYEVEKNINKLYSQLTRNNDEDVSHIVLYIDGVSVRRRIPTINEPGDNFNLLVSGDYSDYHATKEEPTILSTNLYNKLSVIEINGESSGFCPEWFEIKNGESNYKGLPSAFAILNESVYFSIPDKTNESKMGTNIKKSKDLDADLSFRKETAVMIHVLKAKENYPKILLAAYAHLLRHKTSIQFLSGSTTFPLPLDLAKKNSEYKFMMMDLIVNDEDEDIDGDNDILDVIKDSEDELEDDAVDIVEENTQLDIFLNLGDLF